MRRCYEDVQPHLGGQALPWDMVLWGYFVWHTRSASSEGFQGTYTIPGYDFLNSGPSANVNVELRDAADGEEYVVSTVAKVSSGEELVFRYCDVCDQAFVLRTWGFFERHATSAARSSQLCRDSSLQEAAQAALSWEPAVQPMCSASGRQAALRCSLAMLAWETCGSTWTRDLAAEL